MIPIELYEPRLLEARRRQQEMRDQSICTQLADQVTTWNDDTTQFQKLMLIDGASFKPERLFNTPPVTLENMVMGDVSIRYEQWSYRNGVLPAKRGLLTASGQRRGTCYFTEDVVVPTLLKVPPWGGRLEIMMSITPFEIFTLRSGIKFSRDTVVLGGLGLGWMLKKICARPQVKRVIVVEKSQALLDWFGTRLCAEQPKVTDVICDSVYNQLDKHGDRARYVLDIWPSYHRRYDPYLRGPEMKGKIWGWGGLGA